MIINLAGPPAAGKSTFASKFTLAHPEFIYISIDEYRIQYKDEQMAWAQLQTELITRENVILESCGIDWKLKQIFKWPSLSIRPKLTILFTGDPNDLHIRLSERQKTQKYYSLTYKKDEHNSIDYVLENINSSVLPIDYKIYTSVYNQEEVYKIANNYIQEFISNKKLGDKHDFRRYNLAS